MSFPHLLLNIIFFSPSVNFVYRGFLHGVGMIIKEQGMHGVYKGLTPTILKQGSNQAIRFFVMESLKEWYRGGDNSKRVPTPVVGCFGMFAGELFFFGSFSFQYQIYSQRINKLHSLLLLMSKNSIYNATIYYMSNIRNNYWTTN